MVNFPFKEKPFIIGMIHLKPLLGSPRYTNLEDVISLALKDLKALEEGGVDGIMVENLGDVPYSKDPSNDPFTISSFSRVLCEIKRAASKPLGVNLLRNGCLGALALAQTFGLSFIRVNVLSEAYVTDQGIIEGCGYELLRAKRNLGSSVAVLADVHVKHAQPLLMREAHESALDVVERGLADAVIVTGSRTGLPPSADEVKKVKEAVKVPVLIGSGLNDKNAKELLKYADGAIVGTYFKKDGALENEVDVNRVRKLMSIVRS